tara:strand:+ start:76 stop:303 length:228 start_codon:yes stop_codon:yes gene_type:complete
MNRSEIHEWLDNFHDKTLPSLPNKKYSMKDLLNLMPEACGREYLRLGNEAYKELNNRLGNSGPEVIADYDEIMNK